MVSWNGMGPLIQDPDGDSSVPLGAANQLLPAGPGKPPPASLPRSLVPAGSTLVAEADAYPFLASASHGDYFSIEGTNLNTVGPAGLVTLRSGWVPAAPGELALTPSAAAELKVKPGDTLSVPGLPIRLRLVGILAQRSTHTTRPASPCPRPPKPCRGPRCPTARWGSASGTCPPLGPSTGPP